MQIKGQVAVVTGAASGIGTAVVKELAFRGAKAVAMVDASERVDEVRDHLEQTYPETEFTAFRGNVTDCGFRKEVYDSVCGQYGIVNICIPAAGITRDSLAVKVDKTDGEALIYPIENFRLVTEVDMIAPIYWALETVARIAKCRTDRKLRRWTPAEDMNGVIVFIGSISSQGNKGQIAYAASKAGLEGAAATLMKESMYYGVRCAVIHPGFTDTPMVRALGEEYIGKHILPETQLGRLIKPEEIADAICFMVSNPAVSGALWADAGWHPAPA